MGNVETKPPRALDELDDLSLSTRAYGCLRCAGLTTVDAIARTSEAELMRLPNFGRVSLREVREAVKGVLALRPKPQPITEAIDAAMAHAPVGAINRDECAVMVVAAIQRWVRETGLGLLG